MVYLKDLILKTLIFKKKSADDKKYSKLLSMLKVNNIVWLDTSKYASTEPMYPQVNPFLASDDFCRLVTRLLIILQTI